MQEKKRGVFLCACVQILALIFILQVSIAQARTAFVLQVEDGGTIAIANWSSSDTPDARVRLYGIRTPALKEPFGQEAREFLLRFLPKGAKIEISPVTNSSEDGLYNC